MGCGRFKTGTAASHEAAALAAKFPSTAMQAIASNEAKNADSSTCEVNVPRQVPLFDPDLRRGSWDEQLQAGEFAVHYSSFERSAAAPYCTVFDDLDAAEAYARVKVAERPDLRCTIYDQRGLTGAPLREVRGRKYREGGELSAGFRRWAGGILTVGGAALFLLDCRNDFRLSWPGLIGTRMFLPGLVLLVTEAGLVLHRRLEQKR